MSRARAAALTLAVVAAALAGSALAQPFDPQRPATLVIGAPPGFRADRADPARTGHVRVVLPTRGLRTEWRQGVGVNVEQAPLVDASGSTRVIGTRGEVVALGRDGAELWRVATAATQPGPGALLADDSLVFADAAGEAVAVRAGALRWRVKFARNDATRPAPVPLDDGGVVVATAHDLAVLDADGRERARTTLIEDAVGPVAAWGGAVFVSGVNGAVWRWEMGAGAPVRVGSFGSPTDGGLAIAHGVAYAVVAGGARLSTLDLARGAAFTRAPAGAGVWLGPPALQGDTVTLALLAPTAELAVRLDGAGAEVGRTLLTSRVPAPASPADGGAGGAPALAAPPHPAMLVDDAGTIAFGTSDGVVGVASGGGAETLPGVCPASHVRGDDGGGVVGLATLGPGALVAVCRSGLVVGILGRAGEATAPRL